MTAWHKVRSSRLLANNYLLALTLSDSFSGHVLNYPVAPGLMQTSHLDQLISILTSPPADIALVGLKPINMTKILCLVSYNINWLCSSY